MINNGPEYWKPVEVVLQKTFFDLYFRPLFEIIDKPEPRLNAPTSFLTQAIRTGKIMYQGGSFRGEFTARTSRELSRFATYDRRGRVWIGTPPPAIVAEAAVVNQKRAAMLGQIRSKLERMGSAVDAAIKEITWSYFDLPLFQIESDTKKNIIGAVGNIGITPEMTPHLQKKLLDGYTYNQQRNIKNWTADQIVRLRQMIEKAQIEGTAAPLRDRIMEEWGVSARKATFLARQETGLFLSEYGLARAGDAGIRRYRWSTSHDERVRGRHKELDGQIIPLDSPPVVDLKTGRRAHAGEDFSCRCGKIWIFDKIKQNALSRGIYALKYKYPRRAA